MIETFVGVLLALIAFSNPRAFVGIVAYLCVMGVIFGGLILILIANGG